MLRPFGNTLSFRLFLARPVLSLGPGWAMLAGVLTTGHLPLNLELLALWILVDPLLGTLWHTAVEQGIWRKLVTPKLPLPPAQGFYLPYARPGSPAGRLVLGVRRYLRWWRETYWPDYGPHMTAFGLAIVVSLLLGWLLGVFWLVALSIGATLLAAQRPVNLAALAGGRWQSLVQFLIPWGMGAVWAAQLTPVSLLVAGCFWVAYLGGLRLLGYHRRAEILFYLGQGAVLAVLLALALLPGAAIVAVCLCAQRLLQVRYPSPEEFLPRVQLYLMLSVLTAGVATGSLLWM